MSPVLVRGEGGWEIPHDLPLPPDLQHRVDTGEVTVLGPCDEQGTLLDTQPKRK